MSMVAQDFLRRVERIPAHGLGLSADVYSPDIFELIGVLERKGLACGYIEIFKGAPEALVSVRQRLLSVFLPYHAEGLWVTQPDLVRAYPFQAELDAAITQLDILDSFWLNHECASKQMAGYSFGTYLPPLFTVPSAEVTAHNITLTQQRVDEIWHAQARPSPLFLLETPPLTYFGFGEIGMAEFFRHVADRTPCGVVLDVGHLWTVYRYTNEWKRRSLTDFLAEFLDVFPMERVVEVHIAGLAPFDHEALISPTDKPPRWIDSHGAPIPDVLHDMLAQVLDHPGLCHLKGVALEVDTKPIPMIVQEFAEARERFGGCVTREASRKFDVRSSTLNLAPQTSNLALRTSHSVLDPSQLAEQYERYAHIVSGCSTDSLPCLGGAIEGLAIYSQHYLPHEILHWGGHLPAMFPDTCRLLEESGQSLDRFVQHWFREPRRSDQPYDFFLLKVERFAEFVREVLPDALDTAEHEAAVLREGYATAYAQIGV